MPLFTVSVGTPPTTQLIQKELGIEKGAQNQLTETVGNMTLEQAIKVARMKQDSLLGADIPNKVLEVAGTCRTMGVTIEGRSIADFTKALKAGEFAERFA